MTRGCVGLALLADRYSNVWRRLAGSEAVLTEIARPDMLLMLSELLPSDSDSYGVLYSVLLAMAVVKFDSVAVPRGAYAVGMSPTRCGETTRVGLTFGPDDRN